MFSPSFWLARDCVKRGVRYTVNSPDVNCSEEERMKLIEVWEVHSRELPIEEMNQLKEEEKRDH